MKTVLAWVEYITACLNAITKGLKTVTDSWPVDSPFSDTNKTNV